ncbi:MAG: class I SAM-dependent methyltransferase [Nocardioidaceae bacterium]
MSRSASGTAFCRLVEQTQPRALRQFEDPVVARLLDPVLAAMAQSGPVREELLGRFGAGTYGCQVMRTRYIDDVVRMQARSGVDQLVILGAGLDTRAYRLAELGGTDVFEVDLPEIQRRKQKALRRVAPTARRVVFVPADLARESLAATLEAAGLDRARPAMFVWEGVTPYLTEAAVRATLAYLGGAAAGSAVVLTYVLRGVVDGTRGQEWSAAVRQALGPAEPWVFGLEPAEVPGLLAESGLRLVEDVGDADFQERYLRPIGRQLVVSPGERLALAVV